LRRRIALSRFLRDRCGVLDASLQAKAPVSCGVKLVWFDGDLACAGAAFIRRGKFTVADFKNQVEAIQNAGYPASLGCLIIPTLSAGGDFLDPQQIEGSNSSHEFSTRVGDGRSLLPRPNEHLETGVRLLRCTRITFFVTVETFTAG